MKKIFILSILILNFPLLVKADVNSVVADPSNVTDCGTLNKANTVYTLQNDVRSEGSCFAITASGITLDLNGKIVTYDNGTPINITNGSFENDLTGNWNTSSASNTARAQGTFVKPVSVYSGNYALKTSVPTTDQSIVSSGQITLAPNTRYSLSGMVYNQASDNISISIGLNDTIKAAQAGKTNRGFQYISKEFVTGATQETYNITIKVTGATTAAAGSVYVDDIKIQRNRLAGIMVGPVSWRAADQRRGSDINNFGTATNFKVINGTILQGSGKSDWSHGLTAETNSTLGHTVQNLKISTSGANSQAILFDGLQNSEISLNTLSADMSAITSRDNRQGTVLTANGENSLIHDNTIEKGVQIGILSHTSAGKIPNQIYNNNITLQSRYTNGFALIGDGSVIRDNTVNCGSGDNFCRGIFVASGTKAYGNTVSVQDLAKNQEYNGCQSYGTYGVQIQFAQNTEIYNNNVTAYANECPANAFRANPQDSGTGSMNNLIHDNIFTAIATGPARAASLKLSGTTASMLAIYKNTFKTNRRWVYAEFDGIVNGLKLISNRWETLPNLDSPFYPFENNVWNGSYVKDLTFEGNTYGIGDQARFENEVFRSTTKWPEAESNSNYILNSLSSSDTQAPNAPSGLSVQ